MQKEYLSAENIKYQLANLKQLTFEVTDGCNLQCKYCAYGEFYNDYDKRKNQKIGLLAALKLIDYLKVFWASNRNVSFNQNTYISFYGGEPLLNMPFIKSIVDYIEKLKSVNRSFTFSMTTNAILLKRNIEFLVAKDFNLLISLDGSEYNNSYRVDKADKSVFQKIVKNIDLIKSKYPDYFERKVDFNAVLHNRNSVAEIYHFFKERYNKTPSIGELNNMGIREDKKDLFYATYRNSYESLHQSENYEKIERDMFLNLESYQSLTTFLHQYSGFVYRNYTDLLFGKSKKTIPTGTCVPFGKRIFVTVNGKILPCERIGQQFALGKITENGVELDMEAIAKKYNAYYAKLDKYCKKCYAANTCKQCIFNLPDLESNSPLCHGFTGKESFERYKNRQIEFLRKHPKEYYRIMEGVVIE